MHHRCSSYGNNMVGPCTCGLLHDHDHDHDHAQTNSFSMLFSNHHRSYDEAGHQMTYPFNTSSYSVDCTLSLGTPSTRLTSDHQDNEKRNGPSARGRTGSNFGCWDFLQAKSLPSYPTNHKGSSRGGSNHSLANSDPLLARRCANCDTTSTPLWRNGPRGPKSLCNACGIRFKKEERRATAANAKTASATTSGAADHHFTYQNNSWVQAQKMPCFSPANEFRFIEDGDSDTGNIPFLSWRLNVTDRPSLVHDFTR